MTDYASLISREQAKVLRPVALIAAMEFGFPLAKLELVLHSFNTTFRVTTVHGEEFAMRVLTNSTSSLDDIRMQHEWQRAIANDTDIAVSAPCTTREGEVAVLVDETPLGRPVFVTASRWLAGTVVSTLTSALTRSIGRMLATLHEHAATWKPPVPAVASTLNDPLWGAPLVIDQHPSLHDEHRRLLREAYAAADTALRSAHAAGPTHIIHADVHGGNLVWDGERIALFDFDDAGIGARALDIANTSYYLRGNRGEAAGFRAGYESVTALPDMPADDFEALVVGRQLLLANSLTQSSTSEMRARTSSYLAAIMANLERWRDTGRLERVGR